MLLFESFDDIEKICKKYKIENYTINSDGSIDVVGDVNLSNYNIENIPLKINKLNGDFYIGWSNILKSLEGSPNEISGDFFASGLNITDLKGCPEKVGGNFDIANNKKLTSLEGGPKWVGGNFDVKNSMLSNLNHFAEYVGGNINVSSNNFTTLEGLPKHIHGDLNCSENFLTTLKNGPEKIDGNFVSRYTQLTNLEGMANCDGYISLSRNLLKSVKGIQNEINYSLNLNNNELTEESIKDLPKKGIVLYLDNNHLCDVYGLENFDYEVIEINKNPINNIIGPIISGTDLDKISTFNVIKPVKGKNVILKRLKYYWSIVFPNLSQRDINRRLNIIEENGYKIVE